MHGNLPNDFSGAISVDVQTESEKTSTVQTDSNGNEWFSEPARVLLGSDPGLALRVLTGISDSSGYRYANGSRPVTGWVIRQLLRDKIVGWSWLSAIMDGSNAPWWLEIQTWRVKAERYDAMKRMLQD